MMKKTIHLLLIEDNPGDAFLIQEMLVEVATTARFVTETCDRLATGLARLAEGGIDLVLLDLSLPDSEGLETVHRVLQQTAVPVMVLTGLDDQQLGITAVQHGAQDYLVKGEVSGRLLVRAIHYAIERFQIEQERQQLVVDLESFAHTVAHDLKSPLGPLVLAGEMLVDNYDRLTPQQIKLCSHTVASTGRKMKTIVDELLLLASVRRQDVQAAELDMAQIIDQVLQRLLPMIEEKEAEIRVPERWPAALGYAPWIEEVWVNYLSNALKYGGAPPRISLGTMPGDSGTVCFWIRDNGAGIPLQDQSELFTPFTRLDQAKIEGHGLGLSIVHRIVGKLGGEVNISSRPGEGSTFMFSLPAVQTARAKG